MTNALTCHAFSPDGKSLAVAPPDSSIVLWDVASEHEIRRLRRGPSSTAALAFSPNGDLLAAVGENSLAIWSLEGPEPVESISRPPGRAVSMRFSNEGEFLAGINDDGSVDLWSVRRGVHFARWKPHQGSVYDVAFAPGGKTLVTGSADGGACLWEIGETPREIRPFPRTLNAYFSFATDPTGRRIAAGTSDGFIRIWDLATGHELAALQVPNDRSVGGLRFLPDGNSLVSFTQEDIRVWHAPSWDEIAAAEAKAKQP
jgi:WD40 repeat protein